MPRKKEELLKPTENDKLSEGNKIQTSVDRHQKEFVEEEFDGEFWSKVMTDCSVSEKTVLFKQWWSMNSSA